MIEFLADKSFIQPQLDFLLNLQALRIEHFAFLDKLFLSITVLGELWLPVLICSIIYWCIDTKSGLYMYSLFGAQMLFCQLFKMIACIYRPWVLDERIHPVKEAIAAAKGYSFPSGHSSTAASCLGGLANIYRKNKALCLFLIFMILCVGFSRLYLGVHTPQDVIIGLSTGALLVFLLKPLIDWAEENKNRYWYILIAADIFASAALIYVCCFNNYPMDYIEGSLLVNPEKSIYTVVNSYALALGVINGACLCRRYTSFDASKGSLKEKIIRGILGVFSVFLLFKLVLGFVFGTALDYKTAFALTFAAGLYPSLIFPALCEFAASNLQTRS